MNQTSIIAESFNFKRHFDIFMFPHELTQNLTKFVLNFLTCFILCCIISESLILYVRTEILFFWTSLSVNKLVYCTFYWWLVRNQTRFFSCYCSIGSGKRFQKLFTISIILLHVSHYVWICWFFKIILFMTFWFDKFL